MRQEHELGPKRCVVETEDGFSLDSYIGHFQATGTPKMQSQKRNFTISQLQDFLVNYELYEMLIHFGFYI
jgi:hypothetical protein